MHINPVLFFAMIFAEAALVFTLCWTSHTLRGCTARLKLQSEALNASNAAMEAAGKAINAMKRELACRAGGAGSGILAIGIASENGKHFAVITYPDGERFSGPLRNTEAEAMQDVHEKQAEILRTLGNRVISINGSNPSTVH